MDLAVVASSGLGLALSLSDAPRAGARKAKLCQGGHAAQTVRRREEMAGEVRHAHLRAAASVRRGALARLQATARGGKAHDANGAARLKVPRRGGGARVVQHRRARVQGPGHRRRCRRALCLKRGVPSRRASAALALASRALASRAFASRAFAAQRRLGMELDRVCSDRGEQQERLRGAGRAARGRLEARSAQCQAQRPSVRPVAIVVAVAAPLLPRTIPGSVRLARVRDRRREAQEQSPTSWEVTGTKARASSEAEPKLPPRRPGPALLEVNCAKDAALAAVCVLRSYSRAGGARDAPHDAFAPCAHGTSAELDSAAVTKLWCRGHDAQGRLPVE